MGENHVPISRTVPGPPTSLAAWIGTSRSSGTSRRGRASKDVSLGGGGAIPVHPDRCCRDGPGAWNLVVRINRKSPNRSRVLREGSYPRHRTGRESGVG